MKAKGRSNQNKFLRIITIPIRALCKARDNYVKCMMNYGDRMNYGSVTASSLPRSFSATSSRSAYDNEDFRELVRASSARTLGTRVDVDSYVRQQMMAGSGDGPRGMPPRSSSVVMGRIDEDAPCCYFGDHNNFGVNNTKKEAIGKYPRSKSHVVTRKLGFDV